MFRSCATIIKNLLNKSATVVDNTIEGAVNGAKYGWFSTGIAAAFYVPLMAYEETGLDYSFTSYKKMTLLLFFHTSLGLASGFLMGTISGSFYGFLNGINKIYRESDIELDFSHPTKVACGALLTTCYSALIPTPFKAIYLFCEEELVIESPTIIAGVISGVITAGFFVKSNTPFFIAEGNQAEKNLRNKASR